MKETALKSIMRLFAIVAQVHSVDESDTVRNYVIDYLKLYVRMNKIKQFQIMYDFYYNSLAERRAKSEEDKQLSLLSVKSVIICEDLNHQLLQKERILVLSYLLQIVTFNRSFREGQNDFLKTLSDALILEEKVFYDLTAFITGDYDLEANKSNILEINSKGKSTFGFRYQFRDFINGSLVFLFFPDSKICFFKNIDQDDQLYINELPVKLDFVYLFGPGSIVKSPLLGTVHYNSIIKIFLQNEYKQPIHLTADNISFLFDPENIGVAPFSFKEESGHLVGIMGGSGVGKSTLLNVLIGKSKPTKGDIYINGYNIHSESEKIKGLVGYVPQDDVLIEELTVFQNLYFNARLFFKGMPKKQIILKVTRLLHSLGLSGIKNYLVGSKLNRLISGGQRKRLNIALELIREPQILFVDEPTSGLSSTDSDLVIELLKEQSLNGKLVFVNIHQPSSDIFKKFDKLYIMDKGGRIIFQGPPIDSMVYVKTIQQLVSAEEAECPVCGNLNPEQLLQIVEKKRVSKKGEYSTEREVKPEEWYKSYSDNLNQNLTLASKLKLDLPKNNFNITNAFSQFVIFSLRNIQAKLSDKQYLLINLLEAPLLAIILGWFTKYNIGNSENPDAYIFYENINLPVFIFISIVVALFLGLMVSAQEIFHDRAVKRHEAFLNLSQLAYYNSKFVYLVVLLAFQIFVYVLISVSILKIQGLLFYYWFLLWLTSIAAATLGLILSATLKTIVSIYILIPIILIPQILLGGAFIHFDKLNSKISNPEYVPVIGDIMPSRWSYEALAVIQYQRNKYQKELYLFDKDVSNASYELNYYIPELKGLLDEIKQDLSGAKVQGYITKNKLKILLFELIIVSENQQTCSGYFGSILPKNFNATTFKEVEEFIECYREHCIEVLDIAIKKRDNKYYQMEHELGGKKELLQLRDDFTNENLSKIVLNKSEPKKTLVANNKIIRKSDPVFYLPNHRFGRAHLYAPGKRIGPYYIDTYWFNSIMLVLFILFFYLQLVFELPIKMSGIFNSQNVLRLIKRLLNFKLVFKKGYNQIK